MVTSILHYKFYYSDVEVISWMNLRDELWVVVSVTVVDVLTPVFQEVVHRRVGVVLNGNLVIRRPYLDTYQHHVDVKRSVQLKVEKNNSGFHMHWRIQVGW